MNERTVMVMLGRNGKGDGAVRNESGDGKETYRRVMVQLGYRRGDTNFIKTLTWRKGHL